MEDTEKAKLILRKARELAGSGRFADTLAIEVHLMLTGYVDADEHLRDVNVRRELDADCRKSNWQKRIQRPETRMRAELGFSADELHELINANATIRDFAQGATA